VGYPDADVVEQRVRVGLSLRSSSIHFQNVTRSLFKRPFQLQYSCLAPNMVSVGPNRRATTARQSPIPGTTPKGRFHALWRVSATHIGVDRIRQ